jgi:hypothetical protein
MNNFLPSAVKFHYQFNLRETSNIVGGMCRMTKEVYRQPVQVCDCVSGSIRLFTAVYLRRVLSICSKVVFMLYSF